MVQQNRDDCPWGDDDEDDAESGVLDVVKFCMLMGLLVVDNVVLRPIEAVSKLINPPSTRESSPVLRQRRRRRGSAAFFESE